MKAIHSFFSLLGAFLFLLTSLSSAERPSPSKGRSAPVKPALAKAVASSFPKPEANSAPSLLDLFAARHRQLTIAIDPGHGGSERGAHSDEPPLYEEKSLTLQTAHQLRHLLQQMGHRVVMTRELDKQVSLADRAALANQQAVDLFVSLHYNWAPNKEAAGVEVFYFADGRSNESKKLANRVLDGIIEKTGANRRAVKLANFVVLKRTQMAAILVEGGFLSNEKERELCLDGQYREKIALGVALGIEYFLADKRIQKLEEASHLAADRLKQR